MFEVLVASGLSLLLMSGAIMLIGHQLRLARAHPAVIDLPERARLIADHLTTSILAAGSGSRLEDGQRGPGCCLPMVLPKRMGLHSSPSDEMRDDAVSVVAARSGVLGRLAAPFPGGTSAVSLAVGCAAVRCGLVERQDVVLFDGTGRHDYYRVIESGTDIVLAPRQPGVGSVYAPGAYLVPVGTHTYYFEASTRQLRYYDGYASDTPIADGVVSFSAKYWGEDRNPAGPAASAGTGTCVFTDEGSPRAWPTPLGGTPNLVPLNLEEFADGPWCGSGENRFDADLLRIRRVVLTLTLEASDELRGAGSLFARPGQALASLSAVPDLTFTIDVTPRSLNAGR